MAEKKAQLRARRKIAAADKAKPNKKIPLRKEPTKEELKFTQDIVKMISFISRQIKKTAGPTINKSAQNAATAEDKAINDSKFDNIGSDLDKALNNTAQAVNQEFDGGKIISIIVPIMESINISNKIALNNQLKSVTGADLVRDPAFIKELTNLAIRENIKLITGLRDSTLARIRDIIFRAIRQGQTITTITKQLQDEIGIAKNRARLIARDQTSKLDGQLTRVRQEAVGIARFTWRTVGDERVRPKHRALNNKVFSWARPPAEGHPGEPIQCRCQAEPILADLLKDL